MNPIFVLVEGLVVFLSCRFWLATTAFPLEAVTAALQAQALALAVCAVLALHLLDLYDLRRVRTFKTFVARLPKALVVMTLLALLAGGLVEALRLPWRALLGAVVVAGCSLLPLRGLVHHMIAVHPFSRRVLVLGTTELAGKIVREMLAGPDLRDVVVGVVDDGSAEFSPVLPTLRLGPLASLGPIIEGFEPDLIVCAARETHDDLLMKELLKPAFRGARVEDGVAAYERLTGKVAIESASPRDILFARDKEISWVPLFLSRALSLATAFAGLVLLSPLLVLTALAIRLDSSGPIFFLHERVGLGGRPFHLIKFRTMSLGSARSEWAADNEHRTTRVGRWLRRFRIDELPQFLNILRGDLNLVGPRPHPMSNVDLFTEHIPYYGVRCSVRPGITGWAQIRYGYANNLEEETEKMRYDLHYIRHLSLGLDLRILFETIKVVIGGSRSAALEPEFQRTPLPVYFGIKHPLESRRLPRLLSPPKRPIAFSGPARIEGVASFADRHEEEPRKSVRDVG